MSFASGARLADRLKILMQLAAGNLFCDLFAHLLMSEVVKHQSPGKRTGLILYPRSNTHPAFASFSSPL